jgi:hypothetical protein
MTTWALVNSIGALLITWATPVLRSASATAAPSAERSELTGMRRSARGRPRRAARIRWLVTHSPVAVDDPPSRPR